MRRRMLTHYLAHHPDAQAARDAAGGSFTPAASTALKRGGPSTDELIAAQRHFCGAGCAA
jgi:hypothetical protein